MCYDFFRRSKRGGNVRGRQKAAGDNKKMPLGRTEKNMDDGGIMGMWSDRLQRALRERAMRGALSRSVRHLMDVLEGVIHTLSLTVEARDPYTSGHQRRVAALASAIAGKMDLPREMITGIRLAGVIHDLGKIALPAEIEKNRGTRYDPAVIDACMAVIAQQEFSFKD
jgi:HD-GYP domain-containing protein (c-di-GMP phosphodiesterase class II)